MKSLPMSELKFTGKTYDDVMEEIRKMVKEKKEKMWRNPREGHYIDGERYPTMKCMDEISETLDQYETSLLKAALKKVYEKGSKEDEEDSGVIIGGGFSYD